MELQVPIHALSVNKAFQGRRFKTNLYRAYEQELLILLPKREMIRGWIDVWYIFGMTTKTFSISDTGNMEKLLTDIIVKRGYIEDDRKILRMHLEKVQAKTHYIKIKICPSEL
jgi:Holliday junction resolvase RusA-like endonuclease